MIKLINAQSSITPIYNQRLTIEDRLFLDRLENNLFKLSGYNKPFQSQAEKLWVKEYLIAIKAKGFDAYGNFHYIVGKSPSYLYACSLNEKREGFYKIDGSTNNSKLLVSNTENWEPLILAGNALLYSLIEAGVPGHYIFVRESGYKWIKENNPELLENFTVGIGIIDKASYLDNKSIIYLHENQWSAFPRHRIHAEYNNRIATKLESKGFSISNFAYYWQENFVCIGLNPGIAEQNQQTGIDLNELLKLGLFLKKQKLLNLE